MLNSQYYYARFSSIESLEFIGMMLNQIAGHDFLMEIILMKLKVWDKGDLNAHPPKFQPYHLVLL